MTRKRLRLQIGVLALVAAILIASLVISGDHGRIIRQTAYDLNGISPAVTLKHGEQTCETPVEAAGEFQYLEFWNSGSADGKALVSVHRGGTPDTPTVALGILEAGAAIAGENVATLTHAVTPSPSMTVCVQSLRGTMTLYGGQSQYLSNDGGPTYGAPVVIGSKPQLTLWLQAWSAQQHGIWNSLSVAFHRMSLFRLSWVGAWTFWVLLVGVFAGFPLLVLAMWLALKAERTPGDDV